MSTPRDIEPRPHPWLPTCFSSLVAIAACAFLLTLPCTLLAEVLTGRIESMDAYDTWRGTYYLLVLCGTPVLGLLTSTVLGSLRHRLFPTHQQRWRPALVAGLMSLPVASFGLAIGGAPGVGAMVLTSGEDALLHLPSAVQLALLIVAICTPALLLASGWVMWIYRHRRSPSPIPPEDPVESPPLGEVVPWLPENWRQLLTLDAGAVVLSQVILLAWGLTLTGEYDNIILYVLNIGSLCLMLVYGVLAAAVISPFREELFPRHHNKSQPAIVVVLTFLPIAFSGLIVGAVLGLALELLPIFWLSYLATPVLLLVLYVGWLLRRAA